LDADGVLLHNFALLAMLVRLAQQQDIATIAGIKVLAAVLHVTAFLIVDHAPFGDRIASGAIFLPAVLAVPLAPLCALPLQLAPARSYLPAVSA